RVCSSRRGVTGVVSDWSGVVCSSGVVSDNVTVSQVQVFNGSTPLGFATVDNAAHTWTLTTTLGQGTYNQLNATATDEAGNTANATTPQTEHGSTSGRARGFSTVSVADYADTDDHSTLT